ncbi:MAG: hypothetical protein K2O10_05240, partial [Muribaculaceae bacterium]|nr:hypothetical protein [Muribaculaceae bacterium]
MTSPHNHAPAMSRRAPDRVWPARVAALATGIALAAMYMASGMGGDDWAYMTVFGRADATVATGSTLAHKLAAYPASHWLHTNGRAANYLAAYMLGLLPTWAVHAMLATAALALSLLTTRLCGAWHDPHRQCTGALASAAVMFALPWGDEMFTVDVALNYMVASALTAGFVWATLSRRIGRRWLCVWGVVAGMMHEASGVPLALAALTRAATPHGIWPGRTQ